MDRAQRTAIRDRLAFLAEQNAGRLTAEATVEDARDPDSPLHSQFEWDDGKAAELHRLDQARQLIRSVRVVVNTESRILSAVYYVRDPRAGGDEQGYVPVMSLRDEHQLALEALVAELTRAEAVMKRAREIAAVLGLEGDVAGLLGQLDALKNHPVLQVEKAA